MNTNGHEYLSIGGGCILSLPEPTPARKAHDDKLLFKREVFQIVGCAMEVLNTLGHGLIEKPYENALVVEFGLRGIAFANNPHSMSFTKDRRLGFLFPI